MCEIVELDKIKLVLRIESDVYGLKSPILGWIWLMEPRFLRGMSELFAAHKKNARETQEARALRLLNCRMIHWRSRCQQLYRMSIEHDIWTAFFSSIPLVFGSVWRGRTRSATELKRRINSTLNYPKKKGSLFQRPAARMCLIIFATSRKVALISLNSALVARALHLDICLSMDQFKCNRYN